MIADIMLVRTPVGILDCLRRIPLVASVLYFEGVVDSEVCREQETLWVFEQTHTVSQLQWLLTPCC